MGRKPGIVGVGFGGVLGFGDSIFKAGCTVWDVALELG